MKARRDVLKGKRAATSGGLTSADLMVNKRGRIVSKKRAEAGRSLYAKYLHKWTNAVMKAREQLGLTGFVPIGGRTQDGQQLHKRAARLYESSKESDAVGELGDSAQGSA